MKVNIEKELLNKRESRNTDPIKEVQLLLSDKSQKDMEMLGFLAENSTLIAAQADVGKRIELENLDKSYGKTFHIDEIEELAIQYRLRFLESSRFTGNMDVDVIAKIKEFSKETNTSIDEYTLSRRFFILAPPEMFNLDEVRRINTKDPAIFYQIDSNHYRLIHKWGNDFSIFRRILGWKWKNFNNKRHFYLLFTLPIMTFMLSSLFDTEFIIESPISFGIVSFILSYVLAIFINSGTTRDPFDHHADYFTPFNWNSTDKLK